MTLLSQEHYDLMKNFENEFKHCRIDKEPKNLWPRGNIYQNGTTNDLFLAYRRGYALCKAVQP